MPWYEYKCSVCSKVISKASHNAEFFCPLHEERVAMQRVYSFTTTNMPTRAGRRLGKTSRK